MYSDQLSHWSHIRTLSLEEASGLIGGVDPYRKNRTDYENSLCLVFQRAIVEAVERANGMAWHHATMLDSAVLFDDEEKVQLQSTADIWVDSHNYADFLPTIEQRASVRAVNADPENVPILLAIDPWYTATVDGSSLNSWISRAGIESKYLFSANQQIVVTARTENFDALQETDGLDPLKTEELAAQAEELPTPNSVSLDRPLVTKERNVLLSIIAAVCKEAGIDYTRHAKAGALVKDLTVLMGLNIGESTIEAHLKRIPDAIEARAK